MKQNVRKTKRVLALVMAIMLTVTLIPQSAADVYAEELKEEVLTESSDDFEVEPEVETEAEAEVETVLETEEETERVESEEFEEVLIDDSLSEDEGMSLCNDLITITAIPEPEYTYIKDAEGRCFLNIKLSAGSYSAVVSEAKNQGYECWLYIEYGADSPLASECYGNLNDNYYYMTNEHCPLDEYDDDSSWDLNLFDADNLPEGTCNIKARCRYVYERQLGGKVAEGIFSEWMNESKNISEFQPYEPQFVPDVIPYTPEIEHSYCWFYDGRGGLSWEISVESLLSAFAVAKHNGYNFSIDYQIKCNKPLSGYPDSTQDEDGFYEYYLSFPMDEVTLISCLGIPLFSEDEIPEGPVKLKVRGQFVYYSSVGGTTEEPVWYIIAQSEYTDWWEKTHAFKRSDVPTSSIDENYGYDGIKYIYDGNGLSISFRVPKSDYANIALEENEILKLFFRYGAKKLNIKNSSEAYGKSAGEFEGYYVGWNAETVKQGSELRTNPVTGGMDGEIHDFSGDYFTVTVPVFDSSKGFPYDGYKDDIYLGLEYVILDKSACADSEKETIGSWMDVFEGEYSARLYDKPVFIKLQYDADEVNAEIYEGDEKISPYKTIASSVDVPITEEWYALDENANYDFKTETKASGYGINKVAYTAGKNKEIWETTKNFTPVEGSLIYVDSGAVYKAVLKNGEEEIIPDDDVYNISYKDAISYNMIYADKEAFRPEKIVIKDSKKNVIKEITGEAEGYNTFSFATAGLEAAYGQKAIVELYDKIDDNFVLAVTLNVQVTTPITSLTLKNMAVLSPVIGADAVTSDITVNSGADVKNLGYRFFYYDGDGNIILEDEAYAPDFMKVKLEEGKLTVEASGNYPVGEEEKIIFYDIENTDVSPDKQKFSQNSNIFTIKTQAPAWTKKTPTASLASATDVEFTFKVAAPSGVVFDDKCFVAVELSPNKDTQKTLSKSLTIDEDVHYFPINPDGSFPTVALNAFKENPGYGAGCKASMDATIYVVLAKDGVIPTGEDCVLAKTQSKKLTVSTKNPYYADKIALKKTAVTSKLYAGVSSNVVVATVDFGKNTSYTRKSDWEIVNAEELNNQGIDVTQDAGSNNGVVVSVRDNAKAGTYTIKVQTKPDDSLDGAPATASINITVLPTAKKVEIAPISIYHKSGKAISYKVSPTVYSQDEAVIKKASLSYEVGKKEEDSENPGSYIYVTTKDLSISKGTIKSSKSFVAGTNEYAIRITAACGKSVNSGWIPVTITEESISPAYFDFTNPGSQTELKDKMTLLEYGNLGWNSEYDFESRPATLGIADMYVDETALNAGFVIKDASGNPISKNLIKSVSVPNPKYIKKTGKITLSVTTIDGKKLSRKISIVADEYVDYDELWIEGPTLGSGSVKLEPGAVCEAIPGASTKAEYTIWLAKDALNTKNNISGDTLSVKGAKIVKNNHGDFITMVMTKETAVITRKHGKVKTSYTLKNSSFNLPTFKAKARKGVKIYSGYGDEMPTQEMYYDLGSTFDTASTVRVYSTNSTFNSCITSGCFQVVSGGKAIMLSIAPDASQKLKSGSYSFTIELADEEGITLSKPVSLKLKVDKMKKKFKFTSTYTMSMTSTEPVTLKETKSGVYFSNPYKLYNANIKGTYNKITDYLELSSDGGTGALKIKDGVNLSGIKSITGYIGYTVEYLDGTSENRLEKVTVKFKP